MRRFRYALALALGILFIGSWGEGLDPEEGRLRLRPLCAEAWAPDSAADEIRIACAVETGSFADAPGRNEGRPFTVVAWNLERGRTFDGQVEALRRLHGDLLLLSEADRGCRRSSYRNVARELAAALRMHYAFGVEFVELPRRGGAGAPVDSTCEHGNAILSRWPLDDVRVLRFRANRSWYRPPGERDGEEPRRGGRMALAADLRVGTRALAAYAFHLESGPAEGGIRLLQLRELAADALARRLPVLMGGDANVHAYALDLRFGTSLDPVLPDVLRQGFIDAHAALPPARRVTWPPLLTLDFVLGRGVAFPAADVCPAARCGHLSDHLPLRARVAL